VLVGRVCGPGIMERYRWSMWLQPWPFCWAPTCRLPARVLCWRRCWKSRRILRCSTRPTGSPAKPAARRLPECDRADRGGGSRGDIVQRYQSALEAARQKRLSKERPPRAILGLVVAILPLAWLWRRPAGGSLACGSGLLYVILFNLRYAVRDGHTYSLSSVESARVDPVLRGHGSSGAPGWLAGGFQGLGGFRRSPGRRACWRSTLCW